MKINIYIILLIPCILSLISCFEKNSSIQTKYSDSEMKTDTIYYDTGEIEAIRQFKNNSFNGKYTKFHKNGVVSLIANYKYGWQNGITTTYNENGIIKGSGFFMADREFGGSYQYNMNGKIIFYNTIDYSGDVFFCINYYGVTYAISPTSKLISNNIFTSIKQDTINSNKDFIYNLVVATPPNFITKYYLYYLNENKSIKSKIELHPTDNIIKIADLLQKKRGRINIKIEGRLFTIDGLNIKNDSILKSYFVD